MIRWLRRLRNRKQIADRQAVIERILDESGLSVQDMMSLELKTLGPQYRRGTNEVQERDRDRL